MAQHPLERPTLVLMAGLPGTGKTVLARAVGEVLHWPTLEIDILKYHPSQHSHLSDYGAGWLAYDQFFILARDLLVRQHLSIILDSPARGHFIIKNVRQLTSESKAKLKILLCHTEPQTRYMRILQRNTRSGDHQVNISPDAHAHYDGLNSFNHLPLEHAKIIDTTSPLENYLQDALDYIRG